MFEKMTQELHEKANVIEALGRIYTKVLDAYHWDCCISHAPDEEHDSYWFTEKSDDEYWGTEKEQKKAYEMVLKAIENLAKK